MLPKGRKNLEDSSLGATAHRETRGGGGPGSTCGRPTSRRARASRSRTTWPSTRTRPRCPKDTAALSTRKATRSSPRTSSSSRTRRWSPKYRAVRYVFPYPAQAVGDGAADTGNLTGKDKGKRVEWLPTDEAIAKLQRLVERKAAVRMRTLLEGHGGQGLAGFRRALAEGGSRSVPGAFLLPVVFHWTERQKTGMHENMMVAEAGPALQVRAGVLLLVSVVS